MQTMMESWSLLNWPGMPSVSFHNKYHVPSAVMGTVKYFDLCFFLSEDYSLFRKIFLLNFRYEFSHSSGNLLPSHITGVINGFIFLLAFRVSKCVQKNSIMPLRCMIK